MSAGAAGGAARGRRLVIEADGGSRGNPGPAAYGALVRDAATGEVLAELAEHIGVATNNVAEYRGLIAGLEMTRDLDDSAPVEARMDSKLVVEQMSGRWKIKHESMKPLALRAQRLAAGRRITYTWIPRERNKDADRLANEALDSAARGRAWESRSGLSPAPRSSPSTAGSTSGRADPPATDDRGPAAPERPLAALAADGVDATATTMMLVRHGETADTVDKRFSGWGGDDPELSAAGRVQADRVAAWLDTRGGIAALVSSPMRRTMQTASAIGAALDMEVLPDEGFREMSFGDWEGQTFAEVRERYPKELGDWLASPEIAPPGGESLIATGERVAAARDRVIALWPGRTVLVVSHVTPIGQIVRQCLSAPHEAMFRMEIQPTSVTTLRWWPDGGSSLRLFNSQEHLA